MLYSILVAIDVLLAIAIIVLVLIQHGKGADAGAAFGSGASGTVFGAQGSASFLTKVTTVLAVLFFINSLWLAHLASNRPVAESVIDAIEETATESPATDLPISDVPDVDTSTDNVDTEDSMSEFQDGAESVKEEIESTINDETPDDVPE